MSDTPQTDAALCRLERAGNAIMDLVPFGEIVPAAFARAQELRIKRLETFVRMLRTCPVVFPYMSGVPTSEERLLEMIDELLATAHTAPPS